MRVLVVGAGGREHALAWALDRSPRVSDVVCAPGNAGTPNRRPVAADDVAGLVRLARDEAVDVVVVGPEAPLVAGLVDALDAAGIAAFGPSAAAARLEGSKAHAKAAMARWGIPTAASVTVRGAEDAAAALRRFDRPPVVKASGLAAGKGVLVPDTWEQAEAAVRTVTVERAFGAAGDEVVIEDRLDGREVSILAVCSGADVRVLLPAQDHKRLADGDQGPNTGGMGAFAPSPAVDDALAAAVADGVIRPVLAGLAAEGTPYRGVLYAGLMLTDAGPKVLEFNCRLGDPEAQVILPLLEDDLADVIDAAVAGRLGSGPLRWRDGAAVTVVMAAAGYPDTPRRGDPITGIDRAEAEGCLVFHAGTAPGPADPSGPSGSGGAPPVTAGGRVLAVTAVGDTVADAAATAYRGVDRIDFAGAQFRRDIGRPVP